MVATDRLLVMLAAPSPLGDPASGVPPGPWPPGDGTRARLHLGTAEAGATIGGVRGDGAIEAGDRAIAVIRLDRPVAAVPGDRFVLRRPSPGRLVAAGVVLDPRPPTGVSRRRATPERVAALADAVRNGDRDRAAGATLALHGSRPSAPGGAPDLADDVRAALHAEARRAIAADHAAHPGEAGMPVAMVRGTLVAGVRRLVTIDPSAAMVAVDRVLDDLARASEIARDGDRVRLRSHAPSGPDPSLLEAMDRLEAALASAAPPPLSEAARAVRCPPHGVRALERSGRIVVLEPDLAWAATTWRDLARQALALANRAPLTPAAYRDATGTSRRYVLAILEDLDRRGILRRTESGHLPGPRAGALAQGPSPT
jgi:selenocysteine-specific elongation factor